MRKMLFAVLLFPFLFTNAQDTAKKPAATFPGTAWEEVKDPAASGWDPQKLQELKEFIIDSAHTTGMMVIQHGKVLFSYGDIKEVSYIASCRKSILSMLYGPFVENGKVRLDQSLEQLGINDVGGLLPIERKATILNLLTSRSGVYHVASYQGDEYPIAPNRGTVAPGSLFLYNNWDFNLAGAVFERQTGVGIYTAIDSMLAGPLKMQDWDKSIQHKEGDSTQSEYPAYPMWFSTRDMARIGYLMLRNGQWEGQQVISASWIRTITAPFSSFREIRAYRDADYINFGYGYLWWVWDAPYNQGAYKGAYSAQGYFGQYITVLPALDLVIAHKTNDKYERATSNYFNIVDRLVAANSAYAVAPAAPAQYADKKVTISKMLLENYFGLYQLPFGTNRLLQIAERSDTLRVQQLWSKKEEPLFPVSDSVFSTASGTLLIFSDLHDGKTANLVIKERGSVFSSFRVHPSGVALLAAYTGEYRQPELQTSYRITVKDGQLYASNTLVKEVFPLSETDKDLFRSKQQQFRFHRSGDGKQVTGFSVITKGMKDVRFTRK
ncbi:serine hydrolase domain-containing protein [Chitinophaga arvensicola]|nr:serine hydrolase [Chitinophaga arvensicola]